MATTINGTLQPVANHIGTLVGSVTTTGLTPGVLCEFEIGASRMVYVDCEIIGAKVGGAKSHTQGWYNAFRRADAGDADAFASVGGQGINVGFETGAAVTPSFALVGGGSPNTARFTVGGNTGETWKWAATINIYTTAQE